MKILAGLPPFVLTLAAIVLIVVAWIGLPYWVQLAFGVDLPAWWLAVPVLLTAFLCLAMPFGNSIHARLNPKADTDASPSAEVSAKAASARETLDSVTQLERVNASAFAVEPEPETFEPAPADDDSAEQMEYLNECPLPVDQALDGFGTAPAYDLG